LRFESEDRGDVDFFRLSPDRVFWHCIGVEGTDRWSQGFFVPDDWIDSIH